MISRTLSTSIAVGLSALMVGCASAPQQNARVDEARMAYEKIEQDPNVARSGASQLRSARTELERAEALLAEGADVSQVEHVAYLANRHAEIAQQQGTRAELEEEIDSAEERRKQLMLQMKTSEAERARLEAEALREQMAALQAEKTERGMVLTLGDVLFDLNKADLKASGERTVARLAEFMQEYKERRVRVEGYTDSTGDEAYNLELSKRRAMSVRDALLNRGISSTRVEVEGYGETYPVASNDTNAGRQQNRRVEIVISDENGNIETR
ncbi:OmpA family protein [Marinobacter caseinilyticus]|uniref:OmpA family protein n=1 Tax=Marinobacter caseinilyticus TaxID=2692195 RepID=UPI00140C0C39|nr:OmpA family protein [Marinobacter caseinilyticus]